MEKAGYEPRSQTPGCSWVPAWCQGAVCDRNPVWRTQSFLEFFLAQVADGPALENLTFTCKSVACPEKKYSGLACFAGLPAIFSLLSLHPALCHSTCTLSCPIFFLTGMQAPRRQPGSGFLICSLRVECSVDVWGLWPYLAQLLQAGRFYSIPYQMQVF